MMKFAAVALFASLALPAVQASNTDPIEKVIEMISDLQAKVLGEGKDAQKVYDEFAEFCEDRSRELGFEIKTGKGEVQSLEATIAKESATIDSLNAKIEELSGASVPLFGCTDGTQVISEIKECLQTYPDVT